MGAELASWHQFPKVVWYIYCVILPGSEWFTQLPRNTSLAVPSFNHQFKKATLQYQEDFSIPWGKFYFVLSKSGLLELRSSNIPYQFNTLLQNASCNLEQIVFLTNLMGRRETL